MSKSDITVIIPTYNKCLYLDVVLLSIVKFVPDIKIIIVDDGSIDATLSVVKKYQKYIDIRYLFQPNKGLASARNLGLRSAKSKNVLFLDDDRFFLQDIFDNLMFDEKQVIIGVRKELYFSKFESFQKDLKIIIDANPKSLLNKALYERYYRKTISVLTEEKNAIPWVACSFACTLISRDLLLEAGGFDEKITGWGFEDLEMAYRLWLIEPSLRIDSRESLTNYHIHHSHGKDLIKSKEKNYKYFLSKHDDYAVRLFDCFSKNKIDIQTYNKMVLENSNKD